MVSRDLHWAARKNRNQDFRTDTRNFIVDTLPNRLQKSYLNTPTMAHRCLKMIFGHGAGALRALRKR